MSCGCDNITKPSGMSTFSSDMLVHSSEKTLCNLNETNYTQTARGSRHFEKVNNNFLLIIITIATITTTIFNVTNNIRVRGV